MTAGRPTGTPLLVLCAILALGGGAEAQSARRVELHFTPTARAQIAIWIESEDGARFATVRLTEAVAYRGIGNRTGALQMNSGYRWPYGRREGTLPVWAHRRVAAGGTPFSRVIFNGRISEGNASSAGSPGEPRNTRDDYFCLSFDRERSGRDALDAVSCASIFMSNKGRYVTEGDLAAGYAEPWQRADQSGMMRGLSLTSLYPPRRDVTSCGSVGCGDHDDVGRFSFDARTALPGIDAITMATPAGELSQDIVFDVPADWPDGGYAAYVEVNVEGDYNTYYDDRSNPTPQAPTGLWDYWAINYGYAYRGQPSVVYRVPFVITPAGGRWQASDPAGYGALHGEDGEVHAMDATITNDAAQAPGSGADRLIAGSAGTRLEVVVPQWDVCEQPDPPAMCGHECTPEDDTCGAGLICGPELTCVGLCDVPMAPGAIASFDVRQYADESDSHHWASVSFRVPPSPRRIGRYELRVGTEPIVDVESFERALPAVEPTIERVELRVPAGGATGELVELDVGGLTPETTYYVGLRAIDECNAPGPIATAQVETTPIHFTTVSPCFVATAAYGSPLEARVGVLRRLRDRHLMTSAPGRALVRAYYAVGPHAAAVIRESEALRAVTRAALAPIVALAERAL